jgi:hypothetical protein
LSTTERNGDDARNGRNVGMQGMWECLKKKVKPTKARPSSAELK